MLCDVVGGDEVPYVDVARLSQHLSEQAPPLGAIGPIQHGTQLVHRCVFVPEEVGPMVTLVEVGRQRPHPRSLS